MPIAVRPYDDARDRAGMIALYRAAWHANYDATDGHDTIETLIGTLLHGAEPQMFALPEGDIALVADDATGALVGGLRGHPRAGILHLSGMYVAPTGLRFGIGRALIADLFSRFPPGTVVRADVRPESAAALAFYARLGFERIGRTRTNAGGDHWVDTLELQCVLK